MSVSAKIRIALRVAGCWAAVLLSCFFSVRSRGDKGGSGYVIKNSVYEDLFLISRVGGRVLSSWRRFASDWKFGEFAPIDTSTSKAQAVQCTIVRLSSGSDVSSTAPRAARTVACV